MSEYYSNNDSVAERSRCLESQPLISPPIHPISRSLFPSVGLLCIRSKPVCLILLLTAIIGSVDQIVMGAAISVSLGLTPLSQVDASLPFVITYSLVGFILISYPMNGFLTDVYCGRRKIVFISLCLILCCFLILLSVVFPIAYYDSLTLSLYVICVIVSCIGLLFAFIGMAGYGANFIQFGLDQLLEAPSQHQALFVHWAKWSYDCMSVIVIGMFSFLYCKISSTWTCKWTLCFIVVLVSTCILLLSTVVSCWKRHWFYTESRRTSPYKLVAKVLSFAWKHKYPLQRSAFTYCDDEQPSKLDFAKERFGGPFTTEQVEDVKILLRIVLILLAIGPTFSMDQLINNFIMVFVSLHIGSISQSVQQYPMEYFVTNAGILHYAVSTLLFPIYVWIIFSLLGSRVPKMLTRIGCGLIMYFIGVLSVLAVDLIGHHLNKKTDEIYCIMYVYDVSLIPSLGMHWSVMIPSAILLGIGPTLVTAIVFEFISA